MAVLGAREDSAVSNEVAATELHGEQVAFLVGAGRSGTTLLQKLLCLHPKIAYISNYENRLTWIPDGLACRAIAGRVQAKLGAWFDKGGNAYFVGRPWFKKIFPTPNEGESVFASCGIPLIPPSDYLADVATSLCLRGRFESFRRRAGATVFLSKRTANNRRIKVLSAIFPAARYVHLIRDGREVTQSLSTVEWWDNHTVWWDGRTPIEMQQAGVPRLTVCARNWVRELQELRGQLTTVDPTRLHSLRFEDLLSDPLGHLERILIFLGIDFSADFSSAITSLNLHPVGAKWESQWDQQQVDCVLKEAAPMLRQLGYIS
jgi:hypothetical protein